MTRRTSSCRIYIELHTTQRKAPWPQRGGERTLTVCHSCHRPRVPGGQVLIECSCGQKHCKKREGVQQRKAKDQTHHTNNNNKVPFQTKQKKEQNVWDLWPYEPRVVKYMYIKIQQHITTECAVATWPQRRRERVHLLSSIVVTAPVFHFDTSWLNANASLNTARRVQQRKDQPNPPQTMNKVPFQTTNKTKEANVWELWPDETRVVVY